MATPTPLVNRKADTRQSLSNSDLDAMMALIRSANSDFAQEVRAPRTGESNVGDGDAFSSVLHRARDRHLAVHRKISVYAGS
jgi:hypothetical protein